MPREGIFSVVKKGGKIRVGDPVEIFPGKKDRPFTAAVITLSAEPLKGYMRISPVPVITEFLKNQGMIVEEQLLLPDGSRNWRKKSRDWRISGRFL